MQVFNFIVDFFSNLNRQKIIGGVLLLLGIGLITRGPATGSANKTVALSALGILIGGIGAVIIYYDLAKDKNNGGFDKDKLLNTAFKNEKVDSKKASGWHIDNPRDEQGSKPKEQQ